MVYGIVKQSGGYVYVYSEVGKGSSFRFYLPAIDARPESTAETKQEPAVSRGSETVLLVEDEEGVRDFAAEVLSRAGYRVIVARDGVEGLAEAEGCAGQIELLVTDVVMPRLGGAELARSLAATHPESRILFITGYTENAAMNGNHLESGACILQKPFSASAFLRKVREVLDRETVPHSSHGHDPR